MTSRARVFQIFKYLVYAALAVNTGNFFLENLAGAAVTFRDGFSPGDLIVAFTDSIDTAAWLVLLLLLELETFILEDEVITGWVDWTISALTILCGGVILYAVYGYWATLSVPSGFAPYQGPDPCTLTGGAASFARALDDYVPLTAQNCTVLGPGAWYNASADLFATPEALSLIRRLAWTDVLNASVWVVVIAVIEAEVWLKSSALVGTRFFKGYKLAKIALYAILFVCAVYWAMLGEPWDAWDAFLWLIAFFFIEMNVLNWQTENADKASAEEWSRR